MTDYETIVHYIDEWRIEAELELHLDEPPDPDKYRPLAKMYGGILHSVDLSRSLDPDEFDPPYEVRLRLGYVFRREPNAEDVAGFYAAINQPEVRSFEFAIRKTGMRHVYGVPQ